jgi:hypothetical protein
MANRPSLEKARRVQHLLDRLEPDRELPLEIVQMVRAVEVLERIGTPEAKQLLHTLAKGAPGARLTRESQGAIKRLGVP